MAKNKIVDEVQIQDDLASVLADNLNKKFKILNFIIIIIFIIIKKFFKLQLAS